MKKLRLFDSLKFVLATVACVFISNVSHADTNAIQSVIAYGKTEQSGTPTPTNPVPIMTNNGELRVSRNLFDSVIEQGNISSDNGKNRSSPSRCRTRDYIMVVPNKTYTISANINGYVDGAFSAGIFVYQYNADESEWITSGWKKTSGYTFTTRANTTKIRLVFAKSGSANIVPSDITNVQLRQGTSANEIYTDGLTETIRDSAGHSATAQMLLSVGDYKDEQNITTGAITRRVGVKVLDGTENWSKNVSLANTKNAFSTSSLDFVPQSKVSYCTHFPNVTSTNLDGVYLGARMNFILGASSSITTAEQFKQWLAEQYANGTPVIVVYPLETETTENVATQSLTTAPVRQTLGAIMNMPIKTILTDNSEIMSGANELIKIATTKYNEESFEDVQDALTGVFNAVDTVVSQTMTQAQAIDQIANEKQTRPNESCPVGKNCLLVEDENGTPHWYPIAGADDAFSTYTELQYIRLADGAFITTDIYPNQDTEFLVDFQHEQDALKWLFGTRDYPADASNGQNPINKFALQVFSTSNGGVWMQFDNTTNLEYGTNTVASDATSRLARHQCGIKNQRVWCDGNFISWNSSGGPTNISNFTATNPLVIGAVQTSTGYSSSTFTGKIYSATDLVPCRRDSDSAVGLCRTSTGDFFGNSAGVGTITAGPDA